MTTNFNQIKIVVTTLPTVTAQQIPYLGPQPSQLRTDEDFNYNPATQTLNVPVIVAGSLEFEDIEVNGDIIFSAEINHLAGVANTTDAADDGGDLAVFAGNGGTASGAAPGGDGGALDLFSGDGGDALAAQPGGPGGALNLDAGEGGAGSAGALGGDGGDLSLNAGPGGADGGGGAGADGDVNIGTANTANVNIGEAGATAVNVLSNGINFTGSSATKVISPSQNGTVGGIGRAVITRPGQGGDADVATPGGIGGSGSFEGGGGGDGSAAQVAGQGGQASLIGGSAGADGGGGGNNGGGANVDAGTGTGAGLGGIVEIGTSNARQVTIGRSGQNTLINGNTLDVRPSRALAASTPILSTDYMILADASGGAIAPTLPALSTVRGRTFVVSKRDATGNAVTVTRAGADTINGANTNVVAAQYDTVEYYAPQTGTDWVAK